MQEISVKHWLPLLVILCLNTPFIVNAWQDNDANLQTNSGITDVTPTKNQSVLQRMAKRCKTENNCPEYFSGESSKQQSNTSVDEHSDTHSTNTIPPRSNIQMNNETNNRFILPSIKDTKSTASIETQKSQPKQISAISPDNMKSHHFDSANLITPFTVKESASVGADGFPVSAIFPLPFGQYQDSDDFYVVDTQHNIIPIQTEVLNRWWGKGNSLRHIQIHFNASIAPYSQGKPNTGISQYALYHGQLNTLPSNPISLVNKSNSITLSNKMIALTIQKKPLKIMTPTGQLTSIFTKEDGTEDFSFNHENVAITIEENGPLRSVIKLSSLTQYISPNDSKHGWALRLYAFANSPNVRLEFQLQNSAINAPLSSPLYFKSHMLRLENGTIQHNNQVRADKLPTTNITNLPLGLIESKNVNVVFKNFWQTFPNGLSATKNKSIDIELWPAWANQWYDNRFVGPKIYWLDDMQHTYKEILLNFSTIKEHANNIEIAQTFQHPPVAVIPSYYYAQTNVTFDYGGVFPQSPNSLALKRVPHYSNNSINTKKTPIYLLGMNNFGLDLKRKHKTNGTGGWAYSNEQFFVSGNPIDYYAAQNFAKAELNIRPQWLAGYKDNLHFASLTPSTNPYGGSSWRKFKGHSVPTTMRQYIKGTHFVARPRDDQHAWFYHIEDAYLMSGNKWIKDWYEFMAEFKKIYLTRKDPYPDKSHRAEGQAISVALAAYKYTGNQTLKPLLENYIRNYHNKRLVPPHYIKPFKGKIAGFQIGYLLRGFIGIYNEFPKNDTVLNTIKHYVEWNYSYGRFSYYKSATDTNVTTKASGTALTLVDPVIWYGLITQQPKYAEQAINYVEKGIGKGKPYGEWREWTGQFEGAMYHYYKQTHAIKITP